MFIYPSSARTWSTMKSTEQIYDGIVATLHGHFPPPFFQETGTEMHHIQLHVMKKAFLLKRYFCLQISLKMDGES